MFAEHGLDASTAEVAQRAGVGEATLFRRFPHKQDLIDALLEVTMSESIEFLAELAAEPDPARGLERFFMEMLENKVHRDRAFMEAMHGRCMTHPRFRPLRTRWLDLTGALLQRVAVDIERGVRSGGSIVASGILAEERAAVPAAFGSSIVIRDWVEDEWVGLLMKKS